MSLPSLLIFDTDSRLRDQLLPQAQAIILVRPSSQFRQLDPYNFELDPSDHSSYARLIDALIKQGMVPETIVYLWSEQASANQSASASLDLTLYPLFLLSQAFIHHKRAAMRVLYCYSAAPQPIAPFITGLAGFARSLQMEHQQYWLQLLALQSSDVAINRQALAAIIRDELADTTSREFELRYQEGKKFARRFLPHAAPTPTADPQQLVLRPHGCYVIAGGKGALGAIFARYFASQAKVQLVLLGRSPIDQPTQQLISELEQTGSQAHYLQVDISDQAALNLALAPFGTIHGIIQAAGISNDSVLVHKTKASIDQTIAAKVQGTLALDAITAKQPLDFFILFGSSSGAFGNLGQADYAYANSFLNGFAAYREHLATNALRHGKTIAINWPLWADGGMGHNQATQQRLAQLGLSPLATEQGLQAFEMSLHTNQLQMIVLGGDRQRIANLVNPMPTPQPIQPNLVVDTPSMSETPITPTTTEPTIAETPSIDAALQQYTRDYLRALLADATKLSAQRINPNEPFESYGVDSVMILGLNNQLGDRFGELPKTLFFEYQTLEQLTGYFVENHRITLLKDVRLPEPASVVAAKPTPQPTSVNPNPPSAAALSQLAPAQPATPKGEVDIAIIGVSGRYPLAANLDEFWQNLQTGRNCVTTIPAERWDYRRYFHPEKGTYGKTYSIWGGFLDDIDKFDPLFFNISPLEAEMLDPQERIFIQTVWHTLEDAGYTRNALSRYQVGVYVGVMWGQYQLYGAAEPDDGVILTPASSYASIANRVSYFFNFRGPSIALDTMCSSSLTTIHLACESIKRGEIEVALAGGVNLTLHPNKHIFLSQTKFASSEGLCRSFGDGGDGYVPSEGVGAILLKALPQAIQDGDRIYGVIKASAVNHGGKTNGYTVPNPRQQEDLIRQAFRKAQIDPQTISYIEAHGTGTALGDPIEITGLTKAFNLPANQRQVVAVGSVKSNIGHCESAAGIAGITKVLLQMQHGQLVPSIHAETLSSNINFAESPFYIQRNLSAWNSAGLRRAGVSSFGAGGANGHIVLEEYQTEIQPEPNEQRPQLIVLSARDNERLRANAAALEAYLVKQTGSNQATNRAFAGTNLQHELAELVANTLNVASSELDPGEPLHEYGLDAPAIFQLQKQFEQAYQLTLPSNNPIDAFSIDQLAEYLQAEYPQRFTHAHSEFQAPNLAPPQLRLADIAYTLQVGREAMEARVAFVVSSIEVLIERLHAFAGGATAIANCYLSATPENQAAIDSLIEGYEGQHFLREIIERQNLDKLALLWTARTDIDWTVLHGQQRPRRIALPGYQFAQDRVWLPESIATPHPARQSLHPLIDRVVPHLSLQVGQTLAKRIHQYDPWLMDYQVADSQRLPAELLLAMLHTATQIALPATLIEMQRIQLSAPQLLSESDQEIIVNLTPQADGSITAIVGQSTNQPWLQATIQTNAASAEQRVALEPILARCSNQATLSQQSNGVSYGPAYAGLERIVWNDSEALGYYTLDPFQAKQLGKTAFTPAHGAIMLRLASEFHQRHGLASEFRQLGSVQIVADCPAEGLVYLKRAGNSNHLAILDHSGRVYAKFQGLSTHSEATPVQELPAPSTSQAPSDAEQILERFFYAPRWQPTLANAQSTPQVSKLVIIASAESQALVSALCANQTAAINLIWLDSTIKHPTIPTWLVRSNDPNALSHALAAIGSIDSIYLLSGLEQASTTFDLGHFEQQQERGVLSLFRLLKALQEQQLLEQDLSLKIITANTNHVVANDQVQPFAASMFGLAKSAAREYRRLRIACIDLEQHDLAPETVAVTAAFIHGEAPLAPVQEVAQRQGQRYQRILEPVKLAPSNLAFRKGGVYMVLGGAGNVGFKLCCYLAEQCQAKVVITGRRAITPAIEAQLQSIEERGGRAIYIAADMSDLDSMRSAVATTKQHFGGLHGVFHSAMSFEYTPLNGLTEAQLYQDLAPKARGSVVLHHALVGEALDFKLYFSSGEAFTGNIGWGSYAAGCTFEDAFAHAEHAQVNYPVQVINWGFWESERDQYLDALKAKGINPIETAIGMQAVSRVVAAGIPQVMALNVADKVLELMGVVLPKPNVASATPAITTPIPAVATPPVAPAAVPLVTSQPVPANPENQREQLYGYILGQLAAVLKIDPSRIDVTSELTNYGVDSLVVTDIHKRFEQDLGSMPVTLLLENTTVAAIANFLQQDYADRVAAFFSPTVAATVTSQATSNTHEQLIDTADLFALEVGNNQPSSATQPPTAPASITLLRQIEPAAIASELDRYGDQYAQKLFPAWKQNGGSLVNLTELDANPQLLKHLLVNVADKTQAEVWMIGNGPPLVLIPAIGLTAPVWINQIQQWAADYRVIVIHQQGYGMTDLTSDISTAAVAKLFISTLDQLGINRPCHVIGSCFGGVAAQYLTQAYPERVCSLTLCGTFNKNFGLPDIDVSELTIDQMIEGAKMIGSSINRDFDAVAEGLASDQAQPIVEQARSLLLKSQCVSPLVVMRYITQILTLNGQAWLPRIQAPTLCLSGNLDTIVAPETSRTISQQIPAGRYIEIPGAGHYPFLTHVDLFEQAVRPFLREQEAQLMSTLV